MAEVSPILSNSKFELIPLPGIDSMDEQVSCFPVYVILEFRGDTAV